VLLPPQRRARQLVDQRISFVLWRQERERGDVDVADADTERERGEDRIAEMLEQPASVRQRDRWRRPAEPSPYDPRPHCENSEPDEQTGTCHCS
jgi:hypothetical protein